MKKAVLLANLGSPDSYEVKDLKTYLDEFLMDERVIDYPYIFRALLVKGIIVPFRSPKSAEKYKTVWTNEGSPLVVTTNKLAQLVSERLQLPAYVCMRYANPTPKYALDKALAENPDLEELIMLPLYPHYAMSSYESAVEHVINSHKKGGYKFALKVVEPFYNHPNYINALAESIKPYIGKPYDHILFSYHGLPVRHLLKADRTKSHCQKVANCCSVTSLAHKTCYRHQVIVTTKLVAEKLGIPENKYSVSFQSRLGSDKWLEPATSDELAQFPKRGIKNLLVASPAFVADCLETLEELHVEGKEDFEKNGGEHYEVIPCLNLNADWVETATQLINEVQ